MSTYVCAFIEYQIDGCWQLVEAVELAANKPPYNFAPQPWGEYNFKIYNQKSGEKGLPNDLSDGLLTIITKQLNNFNDEALNRPSWMSMAELVEFLNSDKDFKYAHFDVDYLQKLQNSLQADIRVVFWAE